MTVSTALGQAIVLAASTSAKKKSSGSPVAELVILVAIGLAFYFLLIRPQQQRNRKQKEIQSEVEVGDDVVTIGGIVGTVLEIDTERVTILTGAGEDGGDDARPTRLVLVRNAVARKVVPPAATAHDGVPGAELDDQVEEAPDEHEEGAGQ